MGGAFAAVVAQELKRTGEPQPALQLLIYPCVDLASETQSMTTYANAYPLSRGLMEWFAAQYLGPDGDPTDPRASPIRAEDLVGPRARRRGHGRLRSPGRPGRGLRQAVA